GTAPLVAYYFGRFSCYFLLTNLLAIPLTVLILYTSCLLFALSFAPLLQSVVAVALTWMTRVLNHYLSFLASWPGASVEGIHINLWQLALMYVIIACVCWVAAYLRQAYVRSRIT
ncbi:MAG: ComEC/Rec2 family competence protein, partial [Prevotella buccalis]|nr:ComEC/Rec2 family competence protein [Hoylesella buccalis]